MTAQEFIRKYGDEMVIATNGTPLFPSVKMAQAALETGWGKSTVGPANNMFGIKATGANTPYWDGSAYSATTQEVVNGNTYTITDGFRMYKTMSDSIRDHSYLLTTLNRYKPVLTAVTPEDQARALQSCGYATDPNYASKLISIINMNNLKELDKKKAL
ncbi:glucosaminidase domain-containing protein [Bacteroidales bacterium OttesenSCG-928-C03]|nr:glucosaminidase domain-containing protein [Bacteroidales bacterium OttesenSCG-928-C03]MDL2326750.1 glucosaminidase domain-containing protein [Bacteroidales bacterium OttesenSCG-928-A14]